MEQLKLSAQPLRSVTFANKSSVLEPKRAYSKDRNFCREHPDLLPRDVYLASGRTIDETEINKRFEEAFKLSFRDRFDLFLVKAKRVFEHLKIKK